MFDGFIVKFFTKVLRTPCKAMHFGNNKLPFMEQSKIHTKDEYDLNIKLQALFEKSESTRVYKPSILTFILGLNSIQRYFLFHHMLDHMDEGTKINVTAETLYDELTKVYATSEERFLYNYQYVRHLNSDKWKEIRQLLFNERGNKCEKCGTTEQLEAHHLTYDRFGDELLEDLQCLCKTCHFYTHNEMRKEESND